LPPVALLQSAWLPYIRSFFGRILRSIPRADASRLTVSSWYRTPSQNRSARGDPDSQHLFALGMDITGPRDVLARVAKFARLAGLVAVLEGSHLHLQLFQAGALARAGVQFPGAGDLLA